MSFAFTKMHGAANDFVVVDHREAFLPGDSTGLFARICDRRRGVGADGVLLMECDPEYDFAMRYFNSDGLAADFCGNGARCIARFAIERGLGAEGSVTFRTAVGVKRGRELSDGRIALWFGGVGEPQRMTLEAAGRSFTGSFVVPGVPHFVLPVEHLEAVPFELWSPALRHHERFGAPGANVDYVVKREDGRIAMRTWERGVEGETLACGSGAIAAALWAVSEGVAAPITVRTSGGDDLVVSFDAGPQGREATLTGPAEVVFTGEWCEPAGVPAGI
ncbi:MAG: diaminopimelate epimerase [Candidatus Eisenbacteria bacterium]